MAQYLTELCTLLVDDLYGELSSRVFATLAHYGRLPVSGIAHHSGLSVRHIKHGLVVLVQQHLALHYTEYDDITYYEANWQHAYGLVRAGKVIKLVEDRFGQEAGDVIGNLFLLGHTKVSDLADAYGLTGKKRKAENEIDHKNGNSQPNGVGTKESKSLTLMQLHAQLRRLLNAGYVIPLHETYYRPVADLHNEAELVVIRTHFPKGVPKGPKKVAEFQRLVKEQKQKFRDEVEKQIQIDSVPTGSKRSAGWSIPNAKRLKLNGLANGLNGYANADDEEVLLDDELVVAINHEKCTVALRSRHLVDLAARYIGETTSKVYEGLLRVLEDRIPRCHDDSAYYEDEEAELKAQPSVTTMEVAAVINPDLDLSAGLYEESAATDGVNGDATARTDDEEVFTEVETAQIVKNKRRLLVERHIRLLVEDPRHFAYWVGSKGGGEWKVDFRALTDTLIQRELENTVTARYGPIATRLVRLLHAKGKLDEKQVSNLGMIRQKEIRAVLSTMQEASIVETQEVPKDASRQPSRTLYLWFFDQDRCRQLLLTDTYKAMGRLLQRIKVERAKVESVIEKAERTDVVGNEEQYLTSTEKKALRSWSDIEEKLLTQLARQDDLVAILRDYVKPLNT